jgi:putative ATPase
MHWLARMIEGGEDPKFIARRMIVLASEDIGNADPAALGLAAACFTAVDSIGMPEGRIVLAQTAAYLAAAPKSNAAISAIEAALADVRSGATGPVPLHLRNAPTSFMKEQGYAGGYVYPHDHPGGFTPQEYLPDNLRDKVYYRPTENGDEKGIGDRLRSLWRGRKR